MGSLKGSLAGVRADMAGGFFTDWFEVKSLDFVKIFKI